MPSSASPTNARSRRCRGATSKTRWSVAAASHHRRHRDHRGQPGEICLFRPYLQFPRRFTMPKTSAITKPIYQQDPGRAHRRASPARGTNACSGDHFPEVKAVTYTRQERLYGDLKAGKPPARSATACASHLAGRHRTRSGAAASPAGLIRRRTISAQPCARGESLDDPAIAAGLRLRAPAHRPEGWLLRALSALFPCVNFSSKYSYSWPGRLPGRGLQG